MKLAVVLVLLAAYASAKSLDQAVPNFNTAYGYMTKYGIPRAESIKKAEDELLRNSLGSRITGGFPAASGQFKYQAGLISDIIGLDARGVCGGSLLTPNRVLTAAHCWNDGKNQAWQFTVILGTELLYTGGTRVLTSDVVTHRLWIPLIILNDIAMVRLPQPVTLSDTIGTVALPNAIDILNDFSGRSARASGFGITGDRLNITSGQFLSYVDMDVITNQVCNIAYFGNIRDSHVCTSTTGGRSTCPGDSGGPLVIERNREPVLIGLTSFGIVFGCEIGWPAVFTRITAFLPFITNNL